MNEKHLNVKEDAILFDPIRKTGKPFYITLSILGVFILWGVWAYLYQYRNGLGVTGLARPIFWGFTSPISSSLSALAMQGHSSQRSFVLLSRMAKVDHPFRRGHYRPRPLLRCRKHIDGFGKTRQNV